MAGAALAVSFLSSFLKLCSSLGVQSPGQVSFVMEWAFFMCRTEECLNGCI